MRHSRSLLGALFLLVGCAPAFQSRLPDARVDPSRVAIAPVVALAYESDFYGKRTARPDWGAVMQRHMSSEVSAVARAQGAFPLPLDNVEACGETCISLLGSLMRWGTVASMEIAAQMYGRADYKRRSVGDWTLSLDYRPLIQATNADYALLVVARETHETGGAKAANFFSGRYTYYKQVASACVVSLRYGRMIACTSKVDSALDLRDAAAAQNLVDKLLSKLLPSLSRPASTQAQRP